MPNLSHPIPDLDSTGYSEDLRRMLYDVAAEVIFEESDHEPDECGLTVFHVWGRWFAIWRDRDSEEGTSNPLPVSRLWQVVRLQNDASIPSGLMLHEV